eukprot:m.16917 g.16917  ORF g.16917 m.16917 type:complete len:412 (+) comp5838_c0_seq2:103-1338(+)
MNLRLHKLVMWRIINTFPQLFSLCVVVTGMRAPPEFTVDLSLSPQQRWNGAVTKVLDVYSFEESFQVIFSKHNATLFSNLSSANYEQISSALAQHFPETAEELVGISKEFTSHGYTVTTNYLAAWVYYHELAHSDAANTDDLQYKSLMRSCTGIVVQSSAGEIFHGANMDQSPQEVRYATLAVTYTFNNSTIFRGVDWYWFTTGVTRATRQGSISLQENWRFDIPRPLSDTLAYMQAGTVPHVLMFRKVLTMTTNVTFANTVQLLENMPFAAPCYIVAAGTQPGEGVVLTRARMVTTDNALWLGNRNSSSPWYLVQTNYDQCAIAKPGSDNKICIPQPDNANDARRTAADNVLANFQQDKSSSLLSIFAVLSTYPVHNVDTAYTAMMQAKSGSLSAFVRDPMCPEDHPNCS